MHTGVYVWGGVEMCVHDLWLGEGRGSCAS